MIAENQVPLLQPIPGDNPAGDAAYYAITLSPILRELRREESPDEFDDATRPNVLKRADWPEIERVCRDGLATKSKDLRTACHLTEAWTRLEGLRGFTRGVDLLVQLVDACWDRVTPPLGDDEAESRGVPLANLLDDPDRGVCFPNLLRTLPLIGEPDNALSYSQWTRRRAGRTDDDLRELDQLRERIASDTLIEQQQASQEAIERLDALRSALELRLGDDAPSFLHLHGALTDLSGLVADELHRRGAAPSLEASAAQPSAEAGDSEATPGAREEIYSVLDGAAERLRVMEPHSPIPYLIKRAVRLGRLPFPRLMQHVIREPSALTELNREFGIAEPDGSEALA